MTKRLKLFLIVLILLLVQGCNLTVLTGDAGAPVPSSKARFHINDKEYYRCNTPLVPFVAKNRDFEFKCRDDSNVYIYANIRSVNPDGTASGKRGYISFLVPYEQVAQGSIIDNDIIRCSLILPQFSNKMYVIMDFLEISFPKFEGYNPGDSVRINFAFEGGLYEQYLPEGSSKYDVRFVDRVSCTDGVFKEVVP